MFDKKTVFIIGAGAGVEINMPVGSQLSHTIADKTYIRHKDFGAELKTGDYAVSNALKRITKARGGITIHGVPRPARSARGSSKRGRLTRTSTRIRTTRL
jgi:hypothetical protein